MHWVERKKQKKPYLKEFISAEFIYLGRDLLCQVYLFYQVLFTHNTWCISWTSPAFNPDPGNKLRYEEGVDQMLSCVVTLQPHPVMMMIIMMINTYWSCRLYSVTISNRSESKRHFSYVLNHRKELRVEVCDLVRKQITKSLKLVTEKQPVRFWWDYK